MGYFKFKKRPSPGTERQKLIKKLDLLFSELIRIRNCNHDGNVLCITCGEMFHWSEIQCGHYVKRGNMATRWNLENSGEQCSTCNCVNDGMEEQHRFYIEETYGTGTADKLELMGRGEVHFSEHELQGMIDELKKELKAIKIEKGMI